MRQGRRLPRRTPSSGGARPARPRGGRDTEKFEDRLLISREVTVSPLADLAVEPLPYGFTVVGEVGARNLAGTVLFAVGSNLEQHPAMLAVETCGTGHFPVESDRVEFGLTICGKDAEDAGDAVPVRPASEMKPSSATACESGSEVFACSR